MARAVSGDEVEENGNGASEEETGQETVLAQERYAQMGAAEQIILTVSSNGYGKRTSSYEYRITNRGGKGIVAMAVNERNGPLVASFPVEEEDQIMLVTDGGQLIRCPVHDIRKAGRSAQGVIVLDTADDEHVVSVERISEEEEEAEAKPPANRLHRFANFLTTCQCAASVARGRVFFLVEPYLAPTVLARVFDCP